MNNGPVASGSEERIHPHLVRSRQGTVETLRIDREAVLGALSGEIVEVLGDYAADLATRSASVHVLVITGTGKGFVAGADIDGYHGAPQTAFDRFQRASRRAFDAVAALPQATICAVNGYALGGGLELAMCCDIIVMSKRARVGLPEVKLGLLPGGGGTQRLARLVGPMRAKDITMTGRMVNADEAVRIGLALEQVEPSALMERAWAMAADLAARAPLARAEIKRVIDDGLDTALSAGLTLEQRALGGLFATEDGKEGIAAFMEKRDPVFRGE